MVDPRVFILISANAEWQAVKDILHSPERLHECQVKYLSAAEMQLIAEYMQDDIESLDD